MCLMWSDINNMCRNCIIDPIKINMLLEKGFKLESRSDLVIALHITDNENNRLKSIHNGENLLFKYIVDNHIEELTEAYEYNNAYNYFKERILEYNIENLEYLLRMIMEYNFYTELFDDVYSIDSDDSEISESDEE